MVSRSIDSPIENEKDGGDEMNFCKWNFISDRSGEIYGR